MLFEALVNIIYISERFFFSIVLTRKKAIKNVEVKANVEVKVPKGVLGLKKKRKEKTRSATSIQFTFPSIVVIWK